MNRITLTLGLITCLFISCQEDKQDEMAELVGLVDQLKADQNHEILLTLKPSANDIRQIFEGEIAVARVMAYCNLKWGEPDKIPPNIVKPVTEDAELKILVVSKNDLQQGVTNGFPREYLVLANQLKKDIKLYAIQYLNEDGTEQKMRSALFKPSDKWVMIPLTYMAFE
ncbi:hypothetical protein [Aureitalea marina]|uniref:Uncharacterized protein n=1 Tax=Aureitalea marina TaxID=930804 RepID=A0A2S7KM28_9FLAO|nr:hypothetical protein [Aureitalea marina]PQB03689.1 hypothetical protein BST85_01315 [Aureitalea marina]